MSAVCQQARVRAYLRTHDVDASGCDVCDAVGSWACEARVDAEKVREAMQ
jgi:hypothetical protein